MKDAKFRAWDGTRFHYFVIDDLRQYDWNADSLIEYHKWPKQFFTGRTDKDGKDIYEGDILKGKSGNYAVSWNHNTLNWLAGDLVLWAFNNPKIIGTTNQNPELLK